MLGSGLHEIKKLSESELYADFPGVKNAPGLEYYLGAPLINENEHALGALCVIDFEERNLSEEQKKQLKIVADEVMARLELRKKNIELKKANRHKIELVKILSHDMRSPLSGIIGVSSLLSETLSVDDQEKELINIIEQSATQLNHMIDEVLSYAVLESDGFKINRKNTEIDAIIDKMQRLYNPSARNKNVDLTIHNENIDEALHIDKEKFEQIFGNLLSNSIKFTKPGGSIKATLKKIPGKERDFLHLHVADSGIGMPDKVVKTLFDQNSGYSEEGTSGEKTSGLGLRIVKHFVDLHNGSINVESEPGKGSDFHIRLPV